MPKLTHKQKEKLVKRREDRKERHRKRVPAQPDGMPMGKHLAGFKGTKAEGICLCGGCNPKAKENSGKAVIL